jgi:hypothetical protein
MGKNDARTLLGMSRRHKFYCVYFFASFFPLCMGDNSPLWAITLVVLNLANAVRLINKVSLK